MHDCADSVSNDDNGAILEGTLDGFLNFVLCLDIDIGGGFVNEDDSAFLHYSSGYGDQLIFSCTQVFSTFPDLK